MWETDRSWARSEISENNVTNHQFGNRPTPSPAPQSFNPTYKKKYENMSNLQPSHHPERYARIPGVTSRPHKRVIPTLFSVLRRQDDEAPRSSGAANHVRTIVQVNLPFPPSFLPRRPFLYNKSSCFLQSAQPYPHHAISFQSRITLPSNLHFTSRRSLSWPPARTG